MQASVRRCEWELHPAVAVTTIVWGRLCHGMQGEELNDLDLSDTPPVSSPLGPGATGCKQAWVAAHRRLVVFLLDTRRAPLLTGTCSLPYSLNAT
jgi:hypothetical protein